MTFVSLILVLFLAAIPADYKGQPFQDSHYKSAPQVIPGVIQCALYDLGGEGVAYHDTDAINHGSGELNHQSFHMGGPGGPLTSHCEPGVPEYICYFRENEGVDISYTKSFADFSHPNLYDPPKQQLYIGWEADGEWTNYTVNVKTAGVYTIDALYGKAANTLEFSLDNQPAASCKLPIDTGDWHKWNKAMDCGRITFPSTGLHLLTLHYNANNNLAYFDFEPVQ
jgi:hypothetical protein